MWQWFRKRRAANSGWVEPVPMVSVPLTPEETRTVQGFDHRREWKCFCGNRLAIRSRDPHLDEPSNARFRPATVTGEMHATLQPNQLTWKGLAEERGWKTDPVTCPACQRGLSKSAYRDLKRSHAL